MKPENRTLKKAADHLAISHSQMSEQEFKDYIEGLAVMTLGVIYEEEGEKFYRSFLYGALKSPLPIKLKQAPLQ